MKGHRIRDYRKATEDIKAAWYKQFIERKNNKRKQPDEAKPWRGGAVSHSIDLIDDSKESELPSTSAHTATATDVPAIAYDSFDNGTKLTDSEKPHRPDSLHNDSDKSHRPVSMLTRVEVQNVQQDTASVRRFPVNIPDVVDSEDVTLQDSCAKGSGNHSDYWKSVVSFGTASADLIVPVDDEHINKNVA